METDFNYALEFAEKIELVVMSSDFIRIEMLLRAQSK